MKNTHSLSTGEWTAPDFGYQKAVREWDSFTFTKIDGKLAVIRVLVLSIVCTACNWMKVLLQAIQNGYAIMT